MTHHDAGNLIASLVEMAKATERLPQVEKDLDCALETINDLHNTVQRLELKLIDKESIITNCRATIRELEAARDDAELRFLECDDAKSTLERTLEGLGRDVASVLAAVRPMPAAKPEPLAGMEVTSVPFDATVISPPDASSGDVATGQSEANPTAGEMPSETGRDAPSHGVASTADASPKPATNTYHDYDNRRPF